MSKKKKKELTFNKEQLIKSDKYSNRQDHLNTVLEDGKEYTLDEVDKKIKELMKRKV